MNQNNTCTNCGAVNNSASNFCIKCGAPLTNGSEVNNVVQMPTMENSTVNNIEPAAPGNPVVGGTPVEQVNNMAQPIQNQVPQYNNVQTISSSPLNYLMFIVAMLLKPFQCFKEEESKLTDTKTALILSGIVAGGMMLINLLKEMISVVFAKTMDLTTLSYKTTVDFSRLENLDYVDLIFKNLLIYAGVILAVTVVYFLASLIMKKQINFIKMLAITSSSIIPFVVLGMVAAPILGALYSPLSIILTIVGAIYSLIILIALVKDQITFEKKDMEIYFHAACISILGVAAYYFIVNLVIKSITSGIADQIGNYLDFLG